MERDRSWGWYQGVLCGRGGLFLVQVVKRDQKEKLVLCKCTSKTVSRVFVCVSPLPSLLCLWPANGRKIVQWPLTPVPSASQSVLIIAMVTVCHRGRSIGWSRLSVRLMSRLKTPACSDLRLLSCCGTMGDDCLLWSWNTLSVRRNFKMVRWYDTCIKLMITIAKCWRNK